MTSKKKLRKKDNTMEAATGALHDPAKGLTDHKIAGMTDRDRILMMRTLRRQKKRVAKEYNASIKTLQASFDSELENPIDRDKPKEGNRRIEKMQRLDAEIIEARKAKKQKIDKLEDAFDALLFPKKETTSQESLFGSEPIVRFEPEVMATMRKAVSDVRVEQEEREAKPEEEREADAFGEENVADLQALDALLGEWCATMGVAQTSIIDEASDDVVGQEIDTFH